MQAKGYVTFAGDKKFGNKTLYSFRIGSEDKWFRTGATAHGLNRDDHVEFSYNQEAGSNNVDVSSIRRISDSPLKPAATTAPALVNNREKYWDDKAISDKLKERQIQYQSARNAAIAVVDILVRDKILQLATGAKADNVAVVLGKIGDLTDEFFAKVLEVKEDTKNDNGIDGRDEWTATDDDGKIPY